MRGVFDDGEPEPAQQHPDTEVTLGTGMQLAIFFGLVLICGLCFGLGYAVGRRGSPPPLAAGLQSSSGAQTTAQAEGSRPKPSATSQGNVASLPQSAVVNQSQSSVGTADSTAAAGSLSGQSQVRAAQQLPSQPAEPAAVQPATATTTALMVQIAAVSHPEDAEVLVNALRKHGYAVVARRDPTDSLIHVRIGPFNTRDEANRWRLKLLNDGYNAIVQP